MQRLNFVPVIIIGAPRSGTNILRDTLCKIPNFGTWSCDEINPIWRHGNISHPHDRFYSGMATKKVIRFLRHNFIQTWKRVGKPKFLVEKTCANSLRVPFIAKILPEARFIFIVRDGVDVVVSARKRWRGEMELNPLLYYWGKIRHTPMLDLPLYGMKFIQARMSMMFGFSGHLSFWGPRYPGMDEDIRTLSLDEVCARQWVACVEEADRELRTLGPDRVCNVAYEDLALSPEAQIARIGKFLGLDLDGGTIAEACGPVTRNSVGVGRQSLREEDHDHRLFEIMTPTLAKFGYRTHE